VQYRIRIVSRIRTSMVMKGIVWENIGNKAHVDDVALPKFKELLDYQIVSQKDKIGNSSR